MKNFEIFGNGLSKEQMKNIFGGNPKEDDNSGGGCSVRRGMCTGSVGEWIYSSPVCHDRCQSDIQEYCSSGTGGCFTWY